MRSRVVRIGAVTLSLVTVLSLAAASLVLFRTFNDAPERLIRGIDALRSVPIQAAKVDFTCPPEMALVDSRFCMDRYEASTVVVDDDGNATGDHSPYQGVKGERVAAVSRPGVHPQAHITRNQAQAACEQSSKRLCTDEEWMTACSGGGERNYPATKHHEEGACNDSATSPLYKLFGASISVARLGPMELNNPKINQLGGLAKTGSFSKCKTPTGIYDMVGNLHEWTSHPRGSFRGGYYRDVKLHGPGCLYVTKGHSANYRDYSIGFRCCSDAESP